jgi:subtilase family serine protease
MKPLKSTSPKFRSQGGKSSLNRPSAQVRRRRASLSMESLEVRTLLSGNLPSNLISPSATTTDNSHVYYGLPMTFGGTTSTASVPDLSSASQAALAALSKVLKAAPQYIIFPSNGAGVAKPQQGDGPGGAISPIQLRGAYGADSVAFGGLKGDGTGQTIAVIDAGDNFSFLPTTDPNYSASALAYFDNYFGLPDPPSFQKYDEYGVVGGTGTEVPTWSIEIALDVEYAHAMAPGANIDLVEAYTSSLNDLGQAANTAATLLGASVVSQSFGGNLEASGDGAEEGYLDATYYAPALASNPGVTFLADGRCRRNVTGRHREFVDQRVFVGQWRRWHQQLLHHGPVVPETECDRLYSPNGSRRFVGCQPRNGSGRLRP